MRSSFATRLKAFSPPQLALVALASLALAGVGTVATANFIAGADARDRAFTGGDQDYASGAANQGTVKRHRVRAQTIKPVQAPAKARRRHPIAVGALRRDPVDPATSDAGPPAPAPPGASGTGGAGGSTGGTGGGGPQTASGGPGSSGNSGGAGATGDAGTGGTGTPAPSGDGAAPALPGSPTPAAEAAIFVVKDASGTTGGRLVAADPNGAWLSFSHKDRTFVADASTGELDLPTIETSYATDDCSGTPYAPLSRRANSVLRSLNPSETGLYVYGQPGSVDVRSIWQQGDGVSDRCLPYVYTNTDLAPLHELSASDRPPTLSGPLKAVRAN